MLQQLFTLDSKLLLFWGVQAGCHRWTLVMYGFFFTSLIAKLSSGLLFRNLLAHSQSLLPLACCNISNTHSLEMTLFCRYIISIMQQGMMVFLCLLDSLLFLQPFQMNDYSDPVCITSKMWDTSSNCCLPLKLEVLSTSMSYSTVLSIVSWQVGLDSPSRNQSFSFL